MKNLLATLFLFFAFSTGIQSQVLIESELLATYGSFDVQIILGAIGSPDNFNIDYEVDLYKVLYNTIDPLGQATTASGAVAIPKDYECALPIANYSHGTVVNKSGVPSRQSLEANIGVGMAASGYIVAMHDYLGLGDGPGFHPYVHAKSQATAAIDMVFATKELLDQLSKPYNDQLFLFGYSQGGHAAMATHKEIEENPDYGLTVTASAPMSGPYDISGVQTQYLIEPIPYDSPGYLPYVVLSYQSVYDYLPQDLSEIFAAPYDTLIPTLFDGEQTFGEIEAVLPSIPSEMLRPDVFEAFVNDPDHPLRVALRDNDVYDWNPTAPINLFYCTNDEQVDFENAAIAFDQLTANGAIIDSTNSGHLSHNDCVGPALIGGKTFFDSFRIEGVAEAFSIDDTELESGNVVINFAESNPEDYVFQWFFNGTEISNLTTNSLMDYNPGVYSINFENVLTGCSDNTTIDLNFLAGVEDVLLEQWSAFPNPSNGFVNINVTSELLGERLLVYSKDGKLISENTIENQEERLDLKELSPGLYLLKVGTSKRKLVVL